MDRRKVILGGGAAGGALLAIQISRYFAESSAQANCRRANLNCDEKGIFDLAQGFEYTILQKQGDIMSDGLSVPGLPDAMGCFATEGTLTLMRNHEVSLGDSRNGPFAGGQSRPADEHFWDTRGEGGVSRVVLDPENMKVIRSEMAILGTARNCAGGMANQGWLTCEETVEPGHGWVFYAPADGRGLADPIALKALGRMNHEAAALHDRSGIIYLTEDRPSGLFYRFVPITPGDLNSGQLQAMSVEGFEGQATDELEPGKVYPVSWVNLDNVESRWDDLRRRGRTRGASMVRRGEGLWIRGDQVYFSATSGGHHRRGQIFALDVSGEPDAQTVQVIAEAPSQEGLNYPDNLTVGPKGSLFVCEDNSENCFIQAIRQDGQVVPFGMNRNKGHEITGVCFSPDFKTMFFNLQKEGLTLAVQGPFEKWLMPT